MFKPAILKFISYFYPIRIKTVNSKYSGMLELTYYNGDLVLNTLKTNYSYGNLQQLLERAILEIPKAEFRLFHKILLLGVAGGSIIESLYEKFEFKGKVDAIDIDPVIIEIAGQFFNINRFKNCNLLVADAQHYVDTCKMHYNLIIIDLFLDDEIPEFVFSEDFLNQLKNLVSVNGYILFNTLKNKTEQTAIHKMLFYIFKSAFSIQVLSHLNTYNTVYLIKKISN